MIDTRLIFVDGICGSGKSTTAQAIAFHLAGIGINARWFFEHETPHPVYSDETVRSARRGDTTAGETLFTEGLERFRTVATKAAGANERLILESTLLQTTVATMLLMNTEQAQVLTYLTRVASVVRGCNPVLIYLYQDDLLSALRRMFSVRGSEFESFLTDTIVQSPYGRAHNLCGFDGVLAFTTAYRTLCDLVLQQIAFPTCAIENSEGKWEQYNARIGEFLGTGAITRPSNPYPDTHDFTGTYASTESEDIFIIKANGRELYMDDRGSPRLLYRHDTTFQLEGMCMDITFMNGHNGSINRIECTAAFPGLQKIWKKQLANGNHS